MWRANGVMWTEMDFAQVDVCSWVDALTPATKKTCFNEQLGHQRLAPSYFLMIIIITA